MSVRPAILAGALAVAACSDPSLQLQLEIREPYRGPVTSVSAKVIEPPVSAPFTCEDLAFGRVDPAVVAFSRVGEVTTDALRTPLNDLDRTARKLFWVDGLDDSGRRIVTGCAEVGLIDEPLSVEILAEPVPDVTAPEGISLSAVIGRPADAPVRIPVRDTFGAPLAGISATWTIIGAAGAGASGQATSDEAGELVILPELPTRPGPFVLDVRVRWASIGVNLSGVIAPEVATAELEGRARAFEAGNIGPSREKGFAAILDGAGSVEVAIGWRDPATGALAMSRTPAIIGSPVLGRIDYAGRGRDRIIVVGGTRWTEVSAEGTLADRPAYAPPLGGTVPVRVLTGGPCVVTGPQDQPVVLVQFREGVIGVYSPEGMLVDSFVLSDPSDPVLADAQVVASGCVTEAGGEPLRALVVDVGGGIGVFAIVPARTGPQLLAATWLALSRAITFGPPGADGRRLVFGTQLSVNDIVVSRATITRLDAGAEVLVEGSDKVPNVPDATQIGDIDKDGTVDVVSLFRRPADGAFAVWSVLGREHLGRRIAGDVRLGATDLRSPTLFVIDLDADGYDDIVVAEQPGLLAGGAPRSRIEVYSMGPE